MEAIPSLREPYVHVVVMSRLAGVGCAMVEGKPIIAVHGLPMPVNGFLMAFVLEATDWQINPNGRLPLDCVESCAALWPISGVPSELLSLAQRSPHAAVAHVMRHLRDEWRRDDTPRLAMLHAMERVGDLLDEACRLRVREVG